MELANVLQLLTHNPRSDSSDMTAHLRLLALALTACVPFLSLAQPDLKQLLPALPDGYELSVDTVVVHESGELAGYNTYRLYVECLHPLDFVVSCSGDESNPLLLASTSSEGWYNSPLAAGPNAVGINELFFTSFPELEFDSFLTIGTDNSSIEPHPIILWGAINPVLEFDYDGPGTNVLVDDETGAAWFHEPLSTLDDSLTHPAFGGPEQRVLIAQITSPGRIYGQVQVQIFGEGQNSNEFRSVLQIPFEGCDDPTACTFDPNATLNDGSCVYASNGFDCFGNCEGTVDACGVCEGDGTSCQGCTDATACNYDEQATSGNNDLCDYESCTGCMDVEACNYDPGATLPADNCQYGGPFVDCNGACLNDVDGDGICDNDEIPGCTNPNAINYDPAATDSDNSCVFFSCGPGTTYDPSTNMCELDAWLGETGDMSMLDPCYVDFDGSGVVDVTDLARIKVVLGEDPGVSADQCGAGVTFDASLNEGTGACVPAPLTVGEGNGLNNLNPRFFDLNRDGVLDQEDFDRLEVLLGASCAD